MNQIPPETLFNRAVDLVRDEDANVHRWLGRYVLVESLLAFGAGAIVGWSSESDWWVVAVLLLFAGLGIIFSITITAMTERSLERQRAFTLAARETEGDRPQLFADGIITRRPIVGPVVLRMQWVVVAVWILFAALILWSWFSPGPGGFDDSLTKMI